MRGVQVCMLSLSLSLSSMRFMVCRRQSDTTKVSFCVAVDVGTLVAMSGS